LIGGLGQK